MTIEKGMFVIEMYDSSVLTIREYTGMAKIWHKREGFGDSVWLAGGKGLMFAGEPTAEQIELLSKPASLEHFKRKGIELILIQNKEVIPKKVCC